MHIQREIEKELLTGLRPGKVYLLIGPRRVGKTYLINRILANSKEKYLFLNGEDITTIELLRRRSVQNYQSFLKGIDLFVIDEAQKVPEIGKILKLIIDSFPKLKIIVTGSSAFDIKRMTGEPLTGRKIEFQIYPISEPENWEIESPAQRFDNLKHRLIYGSMPELYSLDNNSDKASYLRQLVGSYLFKDVLIFEQVKNAEKLFDLLKLIAFQVGNEVSFTKLSRELGISKNTVERYLDLFSKVYIIYKLRGYSGSLRKEVTNHAKWYFVDNGIRNAIISNFNSLELRNDTGALWENYMITERIKFQESKKINSNNYFWRTYDQQEIDFIEERDGNLFAYELKWKEFKTKAPIAWQKAYPNSKFQVINYENYRDWLLNDKS